MLILIRMCVPLTAETPIGMLERDWSASAAQQANIANEYADYATETSDYVPTGEIENQDNITINKTTANSNTITFAGFISIIYFAGFAVFLLMLIIKAVSQRKYIINLYECRDEVTIKMLNALKKQMNIKQNISILMDSKYAMPMLYGLINPKIILPQKTVDGDLSKLQLILTHELIHSKQLDVLKLWIIEICMCINWFNPIMYFIKNIITQDMELSCDEHVIKHADKSNLYEYSRIIAEYSTKHKFSPLILSSGINLSKSKGIKIRLNLIKNSRKKSYRLPGILLVVIVIAALTACTTMNISKVLPSSFDWRDEGVVTAPQSQGEYATGSIFAAVSMLESNIALATNELVDLSEQHFIDTTDDWSGDKGVAPALVLDYLAQEGAVLEEELPYTGIKGASTNIDCSYKLSSWGSCELSMETPDENIETIKRHLIEYGPVITPITFYYDLKDYDGGVYEWDGTSGADFGHWLTIVGFKDDETIEGGGYWIVKESWGTQWGEGGFGKIAYGDPCGIDDYLIYYVEKPIL